MGDAQERVRGNVGAGQPDHAQLHRLHDGVGLERHLQQAGGALRAAARRGRQGHRRRWIRLVVGRWRHGSIGARTPIAHTTAARAVPAPREHNQQSRDRSSHALTYLHIPCDTHLRRRAGEIGQPVHERAAAGLGAAACPLAGARDPRAQSPPAAVRKPAGAVPAAAIGVARAALPDLRQAASLEARLAARAAGPRPVGEDTRTLAAWRRVSARARATTKARLALRIATGTAVAALGVGGARLSVVGLADTAQAGALDPACRAVREVRGRHAHRHGRAARDARFLARLVLELTRGTGRAWDAGTRGIADAIGAARAPDRPVRAGVFASDRSPRAMCLADVAGIARPAIHVLGADPIPDHARSTHQRVGGRGTGAEPQRATRVSRDDLAADVRHPGGADGATPAATEHARTWVISRETADRFTAGTTQAGRGHRQSGLDVVIVLRS